MLTALERGIQKANLGLNPASDGKVLRVPIPALTEERRKEMSRLVHKAPRTAATRSGRSPRCQRAAEEAPQGAQDFEDDERRALDEVQKITDQHVGIVDEMQKKKTRICWASSHDHWLLVIGHCIGFVFLPSRMPVPCGAGPFDPRQIHHLCACAPAAGALRPDGRAEMVARLARRARVVDVAVSRVDAADRVGTRRGAGSRSEKAGRRSSMPAASARRSG